ncbi:hypothetical protein UFOVP276_235 [uncultured Caudovirales phage]|uniref:Uncharacterized protein n=1 Tax=uncultured Caudovirales phage TaxID=2100421 RepID=A0A6J5LUA4_9CAUD|nr:hypothetical protein UFOVP127_129 [uncultured Caudovirales phage]CAB4135279.1 hypothetical protein UFOVP276_235 [uncultured Caudovirales phage]
MSKQWKCPNCGAYNDIDRLYCPFDGKEQPKEDPQTANDWKLAEELFMVTSPLMRRSNWADVQVSTKEHWLRVAQKARALLASESALPAVNSQWVSVEDSTAKVIVTRVYGGVEYQHKYGGNRSVFCAEKGSFLKRFNPEENQ